MIVLWTALRERIAAETPRPFSGSVLKLVTAGLMAMVFVGAAGLGRDNAGIAIIVFAALFGLLLGYPDRRARKSGAPSADQIDALLPQTQCGQCGYAGCRPYAQAMAANEADINRCPPGGETTIYALAKLMGRDPLPLDSEREEKPKATAVIDETRCIGCTLCIKACPVDAIVGAAKQMHTVIDAECTGCELCVAPCPMDCIEMVPVKPTPDNWQWPFPEDSLAAGGRLSLVSQAKRVKQPASEGNNFRPEQSL